MGHERRIFLDTRGAPGVRPTEGGWAVGDLLPLPPEDLHHLCTVLRLPTGSELVVVDRLSGIEYSARLDLDGKLKGARILSGHRPPPRSDPVSSLVFALCKGKTNDFVVEKATELGASTVVLWQADRSVVKVEGREDGKRRCGRWEKIAETAAAQSGRNDVPLVRLALTIDEVFKLVEEAAGTEDRRFICSLSDNAVPVGDVRPIVTAAHLVVGPEGDFTSREESAFEAHSFELLKLGRLRLRSETAALAAMAMVAGAREVFSRTDGN